MLRTYDNCGLRPDKWNICKERLSGDHGDLWIQDHVMDREDRCDSVREMGSDLGRSSVQKVLYKLSLVITHHIEALCLTQLDFRNFTAVENGILVMDVEPFSIGSGIMLNCDFLMQLMVCFKTS